MKSYAHLNKITCAALLLSGALSARATATSEQVSLDLFFSPGCTECEHVEREVFPELESRFEGFYVLTRHDMTKTETIPLLLAYQQRCGNTENGRVSLIVDHSAFLSGYETISTGLFDRVNEALVNRQRIGWAQPKPPLLNGESAKAVGQVSARAFTVSVAAIGGLLDGFNPCAISTLIFFMSVLALAAVYFCFHRGMRLKALIDWSKRNLVAVKILLGIFFTAMAVLLLWPK